MASMGSLEPGCREWRRARRRRVLTAALPAALLAARAAAERPAAAAPGVAPLAGAPWEPASPRGWGTTGLAPSLAPADTADEASPPAAVYFPETGHHLRAGFLAYWRGHQGPERLGLPLTEEHWDPGVGAMVQHFRHARLEWRSDAPDTVREVREVPGAPDFGPLGRLGPGAAPVPRDPGTPDWWAALAPPAPAITVAPDPVRQGHTLLVEVAVDDAAPPLSVSGSIGPPGTPGAPDPVALRLFPAGETRFLAFAAVAMDESPGPWAAAAGVRNGLGLESPPHTAGLRVVDGGFSLQRVTFAADLLSLLDPEVGTQERLTLAAVLAASAPAPQWRGRFRVPVAGPLVTAHGARRAYLDPAGREVARTQHAGVDLAAPAGAPVAAPAAGVVAFAGTWSIRGNVVVVDHGVGVHTVHAHLSSIAVAAGQPVARGQLLGRVGSTGLSTGPHLHWEVRVGGTAVDPLEWTQRPDLGLA